MSRSSLFMSDLNLCSYDVNESCILTSGHQNISDSRSTASVKIMTPVTTVTVTKEYDWSWLDETNCKNGKQKICA